MTYKKTSAIFLTIILSLFLTYTAHSESRYRPTVTPLLQSHEYFRKHPAPTYWKMAPYYLTQHTNSACTSASAVMMVNTLQSKKLLSRKSSVANEIDLLQRVKDKNWSEGVKENGHGATLDQMTTFIPKALQAYGIKGYKITAVHVNDTSKKTADALHKILIENEKSGTSFLLANFEHNKFTVGKSVGHFSPVAAYDAERKRVLIMDVYRQKFAPYWVPEQLFLEAMHSRDSEKNQFRGYLIFTKISLK